MKKHNKKVYIARQYLLVDDYGGKRYDEEAVFSSFKKAIKFVGNLFEDTADNEDLLLYRNEIVEKKMDIDDSWQKTRRWVYSLDGRLLYSYPNKETEQSDFEKFSFDEQFSIGDIIYIIPKLHDQYSNSILGDYGVISETPQKKETWTKNGRDPTDWNGFYTVFYITDTGIIHHKHLPERTLKTVEGEIPEKLTFLKILSMHLKGEKVLPQNLIKNLFNNGIIVKKCKTYDFMLSDFDIS